MCSCIGTGHKGLNTSNYSNLLKKKKKKEKYLQFESGIGKHHLAKIQFQLLERARELPPREDEALRDLTPGDVIHARRLLLQHRGLRAPPLLIPPRVLRQKNPKKNSEIQNLKKKKIEKDWRNEIGAK